MFCHNCGTKLDDNATTCYTCGATQGTNENSTTNTNDRTYGVHTGTSSIGTGKSFSESVKPFPNSTAKKSSKGLTVGLICGGVGLLLVIIISCVSLFGGNENKGTGNEQNSTPTTTTSASEDKTAEYIKKAESLAVEGKYDEAIATLETAEQLYGTTDAITLKKNEIIKAKGLDILAKYESDGKYKEAIVYINSDLKSFSNDEDIIGKLILYASKYRQQVIKEADVALSSGYTEAIKVIDEALKILPLDQELLNKQTEYEAYKPVDLFSLSYFNAAENFGFEYNDPQERKDNEGNLHDKTYSFEHDFSYSNTWVEYKLDKKYNKLSGTFFLDFEWRTTKEEAHFYVYGDGKLLYDGVQTGGKVPFDFNIDITNVDVLRIEYKTGIWTSSGFTHSVFAGIFDNTYIVKTK